MPAKSLENLLNPNDNGGLGDVIRRAKRMGELVATLQRALPADLAGSMARGVAVDTLDKLLNGAASNMLALRRPTWCAELAYCQWAFDEIAEGELWAHVSRFLNT